MSEERDPMRLIDAGDAAFAELESGLHDARAQRPSAEQRARMRAALGLTGSAPLPEGDTAPRPPTNAASRAPRAVSLKLVLGGACLIGVAAVASWLWRSQEPADVPAAPVQTVEPAASRPGLEARAPQPAIESALAEGRSAPAAAPAQPRREGTQVAATRTQVRAAQADPGAELALLKRAKAHVRAAPARALALLAEHEQRFPNGTFAQEREVIAIEALLVAGDRGAAERARRFLARYRDSAHERRVRGLFGESAAALFDENSATTPHPSR